MNDAFNAGFEFLSDSGLNLQAIFNTQDLPQNILNPIQAAGINPNQFTRLILLGNGGPRFWSAYTTYNKHADQDPIDHYSIDITEQFFSDYINSDFVQLYPLTDYLIPLQQLGQLAGWAHPSPIGNSIHPDYGLWFAYRTTYLTTAELPTTPLIQTQSPCDTCITKPCIQSCPVSAVANIGQFDIQRCLTHRLKPNSVCANRCFSRLACPIAADQRYPDGQIQYHYQHSLESIAKYLDQN